MKNRYVQLDTKQPAGTQEQELLFEHDGNILGKADEILVVSVHVCKLHFNEEYQLLLCNLFTFSHASVDDSLRLFTK